MEDNVTSIGIEDSLGVLPILAPIKIIKYINIHGGKIKNVKSRFSKR